MTTFLAFKNRNGMEVQFISTTFFVLLRFLNPRFVWPQWTFVIYLNLALSRLKVFYILWLWAACSSSWTQNKRNFQINHYYLLKKRKCVHFFSSCILRLSKDSLNEWRTNHSTNYNWTKLMKFLNMVAYCHFCTELFCAYWDQYLWGFVYEHSLKSQPCAPSQNRTGTLIFRVTITLSLSFPLNSKRNGKSGKQISWGHQYGDSIQT